MLVWAIPITVEVRSPAPLAADVTIAPKAPLLETAASLSFW
ncbi:Uncharacterised protein [Mycobacterium tuberculosis]|nr:Uncharacterised protein [Mycobacterium tuberculosis]